jgi:hypothetical protein
MELICERIKIALRKWAIKQQFAKVHTKYAGKFKHVSVQKGLRLSRIWDDFQHRQINDYIACIEFRLRFIASMLSPETITKINKCKNLYRRRKDVKNIASLAKIVCQSDVKSIEQELSNLIHLERK